MALILRGKNFKIWSWKDDKKLWYYNSVDFYAASKKLKYEETVHPRNVCVEYKAKKMTVKGRSTCIHFVKIGQTVSKAWKKTWGSN